ncbi:hypothetical protein RO3G_08630 [Rhizopus delemar RA 99-880]|uniref:Glutaredoxin domain-containing protein n=1 Tax=Rhizopus delemar (strain RA 99-880 / ATCC MYA-4621 / FGSC 9543 / NRRL 43880) TaxID=246409 RepID=I1C645_RHIO9|nr:hypothetical protein RO3G_08630 [Rhizopus delemar RA 99-880]|eukprot:EIE83925.1 hypothetical protein RO3G_08630 [Rhizopus delemar RA 99-880]
MSSNNNQLPLTVQDDIEAKERYSSKQRASNYCNSRRIRLWTLLFCAFLSTFALLKYSGIDYNKYSQRAKKILKSYNLKPFKVVEVDLREDDDEVKMALKEISNRDTFPNIFINGQTIGGCDDLEKLHEAGELKALLFNSHLLFN